MPLPRIYIDLLSMALFGYLIISVPSQAANGARPPDPCDKELSANDAEGTLTGKATVNHYSMSESTPGEGCELGVTEKGWAFIDISIRQGDKQAFQVLLDLFVLPPRRSVAGIGDEAYFVASTASNIPNAKETDLYTRKGNLLCLAQVHRSNGDGEKLIVPTTDDAVAAKVGGLCNKLFAARSGG